MIYTVVKCQLTENIFRIDFLRSDQIPGMRPMSGMAPAVVVDFEKMQYALGSGGGFGATQATILTLMNAIEYGDDVGVVRMQEIVHTEKCQDEFVFHFQHRFIEPDRSLLSPGIPAGDCCSAS